jgi:hypothetical protein
VLVSEIQAAVSHPSLLTACQMALAVTSGLRWTARPVGWSPNCHKCADHVTSERGGPGPYRAVETWLLLLYYVNKRFPWAAMEEAIISVPVPWRRSMSVTFLTAHVYTGYCCWIFQMAGRCVLMVLFDPSLFDMSSLSSWNHYVLTRNAVGTQCPWLGILHRWKETGCFSWQKAHGFHVMPG